MSDRELDSLIDQVLMELAEGRRDPLTAVGAEGADDIPFNEHL
jgi:hypothetical protein